MIVVGAVDIGGTKIAVGLVNAEGQILDQEVIPTPRDREFSYALPQMQAALHRCSARHPEIGLSGVGIGCTGPVDPRTGVLGPNSFMPLWEGIDVLPLFEGAFDLPTAIENDADAAALGEAAWGVGRGAQRFLYITVSTGIGAGWVQEGRLYRGADDVHTEMGHMILDPVRGPLCPCGARGCWESLASGPAMANWYQEQQRERQPGTAADVRPINAYEICQRAQQGEALAREAVQREGEYLGMGLANLITILLPDCIALGGGVMESWPLFAPVALEVIHNACGLVPQEKTSIRRAALGARTGLVGAARVWFHRFGEEPAD